LGHFPFFPRACLSLFPPTEAPFFFPLIFPSHMSILICLDRRLGDCPFRGSSHVTSGDVVYCKVPFLIPSLITTVIRIFPAMPCFSMFFSFSWTVWAFWAWLSLGTSYFFFFQRRLPSLILLPSCDTPPAELFDENAFRRDTPEAERASKVSPPQLLAVPLFPPVPYDGYPPRPLSAFTIAPTANLLTPLFPRRDPTPFRSLLCSFVQCVP